VIFYSNGYEHWIWDDIPDSVDAAEVNKRLFNIDTVDLVIAHLMQNGLKVEGGDRLGKTIIFAKNQAHAVFIEGRFNAAYPHLAGHFARVGDFLSTGTASAAQIEFINMVVEHLTDQGIMDPVLLYEPPFTDSRQRDRTMCLVTSA
jgi:type I site-specific restriction endonuclease